MEGTGGGGCGLPNCIINPPTQNPPQQPSLPTISQPEYTYVPVMTPDQGLTWKSVPLQKPTPVTDYVKDRIPGSSTTWGYISTTLDVLAWMTDAYAAGVVTYGGIAGAGITSPFIAAGLPEIPVASGWAGAAVAELYVQPTLRLGNILATASTIATYVSETKAGETVIETGLISNVTKNSVSLTVLGWAAPSEAYISFVFQSTAVLNDFGVISIPFR